MNAVNPKRTSPVLYLLILAALALLAAVYYSPVWWVSLTAPNYPPEAFPDGVRIEFHMNGVFNGCTRVEKAEIQEEEALDCVHEMDTINHYVGMYPIAAGGVVERAFSPFLLSLLGVMLVGFMIPRAGLRVGIMALGFAGVAVWMSLYLYAADGLRYQNEGYLSALVNALDQSAGEQAEELSPGEALIARLKAELAAASAKQEQQAGGPSDKRRLIENLRVNFEKDQERRPADAREVWTGSGAQMLVWHYAKTLGRYFNNPAEIAPMAAKMSVAAHLVFWALIVIMLLLVWAGRRNGGIGYWLLALAPLGLPLFFLMDYSAWLWWYGHNLNEMGAFAVKPFMPTVFGDGKVAQFATHSYPSVGFGLMLVLSACVALAALLRRKQWRGER
jgi:hypothetical protein